MKIRYGTWSGVQEEPIVQYVEGEITNTYGDGAVENARDMARKGAEVLGRLINSLAARGMLNAAEIVYIVEGYGAHEDATLLP